MMITSIRAPMPATVTPQSVDPSHSAANAQAVRNDVGVAERTLLTPSAPPSDAKRTADLLAMRATAETSAADAAEAARAAYIRASIAAGLNPLPLA